MTVVIYTKDGPNASSSYYRLLQYKSAIEDASGDRAQVRALVPDVVRRWRYDVSGVPASVARATWVRLLYAGCTYVFALHYMAIDLLQGVDCVIVSRSLTPRTYLPPVSGLYRRLLGRARRVIWDFDDDIVAGNEISAQEFDLLGNCADAIVVTHGGLKENLPATWQAKTAIVPTTDGDYRDLDLNEAFMTRQATFAAEFRIVWVASSSGLPDLISIAGSLDSAAETVTKEQGKRVTLEVVCNLPLRFRFEHLRLVNTAWTRAEAIRAITEAHVGIMPLIDNEYSRGKGGFKIVQYMAAGLPTVASNVGFNKEIVMPGLTGFLVPADDNAAWKTAILQLATNGDLWQGMSQAAAERWREAFPFQKTSQFWAGMVARPGWDRHE